MERALHDQVLGMVYVLREMLDETVAARYHEAM